MGSDRHLSVSLLGLATSWLSWRFLLPFSIANLRASCSDTLLASDTSLTAAGGVAYEMCTRIAEELWCRVPLKLKGQRLLDHLSADLKASGFDVEGESDESEEEIDDVYEELPNLGASSPTSEADTFCWRRRRLWRRMSLN